MNAAEKKLTVPEGDEGLRADLFVAKALGLSRSELKALFEARAVRLGSKALRKGDRVLPGQTIAVALPTEGPALSPQPELPLCILFQDDALVFVDKPANVPSHPLEPGELGTVANAIAARFPECEAAGDSPREGGLCHRLDRGTSGVLLAARTKEAWAKVRQAFTEQRVKKRYWAVAVGPLADDGTLDVPLRPGGRGGERAEPSSLEEKGARPALTSFRVLSRSGAYSLCEVDIATGVLHQIRAHLAAIGAPLAGDALYGGREEPGLSRFFLHAHSLALAHPQTGNWLEVKSPLPEDLARFLAAKGLILPYPP
jgi:23S rRNA pseudouridine1911/1915/1917 synthase